MSSPQTQSPQTQSAQHEALRAGLARLVAPWWAFLLTGIAWLIISMVVLRFTATSAFTIGILMGAVFLGAMANEFLIASGGRAGGGRALMGILCRHSGGRRGLAGRPPRRHPERGLGPTDDSQAHRLQ